jgi:2-methylisocitrate lyase-like PEP mutase family enzyme
VTFVEAPRTAAELQRIGELPVPQIANIVHGGLTPELGQEKLKDMGFAVALYANAALQAALRAVHSVLGGLKERGSLQELGDQLASFEERQQAVNKPLFDKLEKRYRAPEA